MGEKSFPQRGPLSLPACPHSTGPCPNPIIGTTQSLDTIVELLVGYGSRLRSPPTPQPCPAITEYLTTHNSRNASAMLRHTATKVSFQNDSHRLPFRRMPQQGFVQIPIKNGEFNWQQNSDMSLKVKTAEPCCAPSAHPPVGSVKTPAAPNTEQKPSRLPERYRSSGRLPKES